MGDRTSLRPAAWRMMARVAEADRRGTLLAFNQADMRCYPRLSALGLVAVNIYRPGGGICFTPKGRKCWRRQHG